MFEVAASDPSGPVEPGAPAAPTPSSAGSAGGTTFYRYHDGRGRIVIVDSLERVPSSSRGSLETVVLARPAEPIASLQELSEQNLHWPSFAVGAGCMLLAGLAWIGLRRLGHPLLRYSLLGGLVLLGAGAYFGWLRRSTGQSESLVSSPAALIEDARSAVEKMNARAREQQRVLKELESQP
jgi:hypothetical protein